MHPCVTESIDNDPRCTCTNLHNGKLFQAEVSKNIKWRVSCLDQYIFNAKFDVGENVPLY